VFSKIPKSLCPTFIANGCFIKISQLLRDSFTNGTDIALVRREAFVRQKAVCERVVLPKKGESYFFSAETGFQSEEAKKWCVEIYLLAKEREQISFIFRFEQEFCDRKSAKFVQVEEIVPKREVVYTKHVIVTLNQ